jgi:alpha-1,3-rhamnosyl/mannosyltransferase
MTSAVQRTSVDVFFSPSVYTYHPLPPTLPAVVTIHDAIPERFPNLVFPSAKTRILWGLKVRLAIFQARRFVTVSEYSARDLVRVLGIPREKITVAVEAPSAEYRPRESATTSATAELPADARWFVFVGGFSRHKNVPLLIRAHAALARELGDAAPYLLLVGTRERDDFYTDVASIESEIEKQGTSRLVKWTGFVSDEELSAIHSRSLGLLLPSECEGFGLPAVEAAACGSPVIATVESPLPELLQGGGIFVRPGDIEALTSGMRRLATDSAFQASAGATARARAHGLSWEKSAAAVLDAIRMAAA